VPLGHGVDGRGYVDSGVVGLGEQQWDDHDLGVTGCHQTVDDGLERRTTVLQEGTFDPKIGTLGLHLADELVDRLGVATVAGAVSERD
jgi:hypothetical protein